MAMPLVFFSGAWPRARLPWPVGRPRRSRLSLIRLGTPAKKPLKRLLSARWRAASKVSRVSPFRMGSTRCSRAMAASVTSRLLTWPWRNRSARAVASSCPRASSQKAWRGLLAMSLSRLKRCTIVPLMIGAKGPIVVLRR